MSGRCPAVLTLLLMLNPLALRAQEAGPGPGSGSSAREPVPMEQRENMVRRREAIRLALENNLDIESARYDPLVADSQVRQARGQFNPILTAEARFDHDEVPTASPFQILFGGSTVFDNDQWTYSGGLAGLVPFGLEYSSKYEFVRTESTSSFLALRPQYTGRWVTQLTLPLLRDLINNEASILVRRTRVGRNISNERFRQQLTDIIVRVEEAYWRLAAARANERVANKSLERAQQLLEQEQVRFEVGVVSRVSVTQARAGVAEREVSEIVASNLLDEAHDSLLRELYAPDAAGYATREVVPEDAELERLDVDLPQAIEKALEYRPELAQSRGLVEDADLQAALAENQLLPSLDVIGRYQLDGLAGDPIFRPRDPTAPGTPSSSELLGQQIPKGGSEVDDDFFDATGNHSWTVGAQFSLPLSNDTAKGTYTQRRIELRRAQTAYRQQEQVVLTEVRRAVRDLRSSIRSVEASDRRRVAQLESLNAEEERLKHGDSTSFRVLELEEDLAEAEQQLIVSLQRHRNSIAQLEKAQGTLLRTEGIEIIGEIEREPPVKLPRP